MALSILMWVAVELTRFLFDTSIEPAGDAQIHQKWLFVNVFSAFNNAFILASVPFFRNVIDSSKIKFGKFVKWEHWSVTVLTINTIVVLVYIVSWMLKIELGSTLIPVLDYIYSLTAISAFLYGAILTLRQAESFGNFGILVLVVCSLLLVFIQYIIFPAFDAEQGFRFISLYASHFIIIIMMLLSVLTNQYLTKTHILESENVEAIKLNEVLQSKLRALQQNANGSKRTSSKVHLAYGRYLKFYGNEEGLVVELTFLDKGIMRQPIHSSVVNREYKDLLRFAVYKKSGMTIKAHGGAHSGFGDIYKSILDIRNRLINKPLKNIGCEPLKANELIVQRIKGSGIYELDCIAENIEIDMESLSKVKELAPILSILTESTNI